jgi:hypothetical protein
VCEYYRQMKGMANSLHDLGEPVADRTFLLNLLRGLSLRYGHLKALIKRIVPFPTFHVVHNEFPLEELTMETETPTSHPGPLQRASQWSGTFGRLGPSPFIDWGSYPPSLVGTAFSVSARHTIHSTKYMLCRVLFCLASYHNHLLLKF